MDFVDASLVQRAFLGDNYGDDGVQVKWVAPLASHLLEFGAELGRGKGSGPPAEKRQRRERTVCSFRW